jgi:hypothetical protein
MHSQQNIKYIYISDERSDKLSKRSKLEICHTSCVGPFELAELKIKKYILFRTIFNSFIFTFSKRNMR